MLEKIKIKIKQVERHSATPASRPTNLAQEHPRSGSISFLLLLPLHRALGPIRFEGLRFALLVEGFPGLAHPSDEAPVLHIGTEHLQGSAAGIDLLVMSEIGEPFEGAEQVLVPAGPPDLDVAGAALRADRPEPRDLVAALCRRHHGEAAERAYQVRRLALAGLPRILAESDANPCAVLCRGIEQQSVDVARVRPFAQHPAANSRRSYRGRAQCLSSNPGR